MMVPTIRQGRDGAQWVTIAATDRFLALCVRQWRHDQTLPPWPKEWGAADAALCQSIFDRIAFHGIALLLAQHAKALAAWPALVRDKTLAEARAQSFWEMGHRESLARLIEALAAAGITGAVTKGSAMAYTLYAEPALRRRGDSDVLLPGADRRAVDAVLAAIGMVRTGDARPLQESWATNCAMGFTHVFDLHWRGNASALISHCHDRAGIGQRTVPMPRLSSAARAISPADNAILIAINRAMHLQFGYVSGPDKTFEQDRLIWAVDLDLLSASFDERDWQALVEAAEASGAAPLVLSALDFAQSTLETPIPTTVRTRLAAHPGDPRLLRYLGALPGIERLRLDLSASPTLADKLRLVRYTLLPGSEVLHERFPTATHWPIPALQARRLMSGAGKLLLGRG